MYSLLLCCFSAEASAIKAFQSKYKTCSESKFVSKFMPYTSLAIAEESVFQALFQLHHDLAAGDAVWTAPTKKKGAELKGADPQAAQIPSALTQIILPSKASLPRWNVLARTSTINYLLENKQVLHSLFQGSWTKVYSYVNRRLAVELVYHTLADELGFVREGGESLPFSPGDELIPDKKLKADVTPPLPCTGYEVPLFDWAAWIAGTEVFGDTDIKRYVEGTLTDFLLNQQKTKMKVKGGAYDTSDLVAPQNNLWNTFFSKISNYIFEPIARQTAVRTAGQGVSGNAFEPDSLGFVEYRRYFAKLKYVQAEKQKADGNFDGTFSDTELDMLRPAHYARDLEALSAGNKVQMMLWHEDAFVASSVLSAHLEHAGGNYTEITKKMTVGFADPPWGINNDPTLYGGIDLPEERWSEYVRECLLLSSVLNECILTMYRFGFFLPGRSSTAY
jgi:hypothetical protein